MSRAEQVVSYPEHCERSQTASTLRKLFAFSLAEMMIVMAVMTVVLALAVPLITKKRKTSPAVATIPIRNEGDPCTASEGLARTSDNTSQLTCKSGIWVSPGVSKRGTGWRIDDDGTITQWGCGTEIRASYASQVVNFAITFPHAVLSVQTSPLITNANAGSAGTIGYLSVSNKDIVLYQTSTSTFWSYPCYVAIGY